MIYKLCTYYSPKVCRVCKRIYNAYTSYRISRKCLQATNVHFETYYNNIRLTFLEIMSEQNVLYEDKVFYSDFHHFY